MKEGRKMKSNELFEQIHNGRIKDNTKIKVINELTGNCVTTISYKNGRLNWQAGEFDTSFLCNIDIEFVIEENKEIEELGEMEIINSRPEVNARKINELVRAVNKLNKDLEKLQTLNIEINEETINNAIKRVRNYLEREENKNEI